MFYTYIHPLSRSLSLSLSFYLSACAGWAESSIEGRDDTQIEHKTEQAMNHRFKMLSPTTMLLKSSRRRRSFSKTKTSSSNSRARNVNSLGGNPAHDDRSTIGLLQAALTMLQQNQREAEGLPPTEESDVTDGESTSGPGWRWELEATQSYKTPNIESDWSRASSPFQARARESGREREKKGGSERGRKRERASEREGEREGERKKSWQILSCVWRVVKALTCSEKEREGWKERKKIRKKSCCV